MKKHLYLNLKVLYLNICTLYANKSFNKLQYLWKKIAKCKMYLFIIFASQLKIPCEQIFVRTDPLGATGLWNLLPVSIQTAGSLPTFNGNTTLWFAPRALARVHGTWRPV